VSETCTAFKSGEISEVAAPVPVYIPGSGATVSKAAVAPSRRAPAKRSSTKPNQKRKTPRPTS
jgi:hypothetical protein